MITNKNSTIFFSILALFIPAASAAFSGSYDMTNQADISWNGTYSGSVSGWILDWADLNDDGYADAIVSAYLNNSAQGAVYILYGPQDQVTDVSIQSKADVTLSGETASTYFGVCLGSGDINGDGYDDLLIGSTAYPSGQADGRLYIIYGRNGTIPSGNIATVKNASITGTQYYALALGWECDAADVNGDGYDDILVSAWVSNFGQTYLIYGQSAPFTGDSAITSVYNESWLGAAANDKAYYVRRA